MPNGVRFMTRIHRRGNAIDAKNTRINIKFLIERLGLSDLGLQQFQDGGSIDSNGYTKISPMGILCLAVLGPSSESSRNLPAFSCFDSWSCIARA